MNSSTSLVIFLILIITGINGLPHGHTDDNNDFEDVKEEETEPFPTPNYLADLGNNCTGSIISQKHILTSSSCIKSRQVPFIIRNGLGPRIPKVGKAYEVERIFKHPLSDESMEYGYAILKLTHPIEFNNDTMPINLPGNSNYEIPDCTELRAVGFTSNMVEYEGDNRWFRIQNETPMTKFNESVCAAKADGRRENFKVTDGILCAMDVQKLSRFYDKGSPVVIGDRVQVGVITPLHPDLLYKLPEMFLRVSKVIDWIYSILAKETESRMVFG